MFSSKEGITNGRNHKNKQSINQTREREICIRSIRRESYWYQGLGWTWLPGVREERRWVSPICCPWKSAAWALRRGAEREWTRSPDGEMGRQWKPLSARWAIWPHTYRQQDSTTLWSQARRNCAEASIWRFFQQLWAWQIEGKKNQEQKNQPLNFGNNNSWYLLGIDCMSGTVLYLIYWHI